MPMMVMMMVLFWWWPFESQIWSLFQTGDSNWFLAQAATNSQIPSSRFYTMTMTAMMMIPVLKAFSPCDNFLLLPILKAWKQLCRLVIAARKLIRAKKIPQSDTFGIEWPRMQSVCVKGLSWELQVHCSFCKEGLKCIVVEWRDKSIRTQCWCAGSPLPCPRLFLTAAAA